MKGYSIQNFHKRKAAGELLPHTRFWQSKVSNVQFDPGAVLTYQKSIPSRWWNWYNHTYAMDVEISIPEPDLSGVGAELQRAASRIMSNGFDALTFMAEAEKTKDMLRDVNRTFGRLLMDKRNLAKTAQNASKAWLEGRYGWSILASEIKQLHEAVTDFDRERTIWSERSGYSYSFTDTSNVTKLAPGSVLGTFTGTTTRNVSHSIRGFVTASVQPARFQLNPVQTAWELIPLSFVIDWAIQVGDAIQATHLMIAASGVTASSGIRTTVAHNSVQTGVSGNSAFHRDFTPCGFSYFAEREVREPASVPLAPQIPRRLIHANQVTDLTAIYRAKRLWGNSTRR
jgi:hypothetical protein